MILRTTVYVQKELCKEKRKRTDLCRSQQEYLRVLAGGWTGNEATGSRVPPTGLTRHIYDYTKLQKEEVLGDLLLKYIFLSLLAY